jgi:hypothetical protein
MNHLVANVSLSNVVILHFILSYGQAQGRRCPAERTGGRNHPHAILHQRLIDISEDREDDHVLDRPQGYKIKGLGDSLLPDMAILPGLTSESRFRDQLPQLVGRHIPAILLKSHQ